MPELEALVIIAQTMRMSVDIFVSYGWEEANEVAGATVSRRHERDSWKVRIALASFPQPAFENPVHLGVVQDEERIVGRAGSNRECSNSQVVHPVMHHKMGSEAMPAVTFKGQEKRTT